MTESGPNKAKAARARAASMTEERRSEIAREAARERWKRAAEASPEATILTPEEAVALEAG